MGAQTFALQWIISRCAQRPVFEAQEEIIQHLFCSWEIRSGSTQHQNPTNTWGGCFHKIGNYRIWTKARCIKADRLCFTSLIKNKKNKKKQLCELFKIIYPEQDEDAFISLYCRHLVAGWRIRALSIQ